MGVLLGALATPQPARASEKEEARKHYDRAIELVDDGQLEGAIVEFQRSYDLTHHFAVLYNIGQVFVSLAKPVEAVDAYQRYLADGGKKILAARRAEVEKEIARQRARIATLEIRGLPEGAMVRLDGKEIGKAPIAAPVRVGVGTQPRPKATMRQRHR
jgi:tetratricopeptide (TPR) repeat protein